MLQATLASEFLPGTNLPGDATGAGWVHLLPELELERVLCLGAPSPGSLRSLAHLSREVLVCAAPGGRLAALQRLAALEGLRAVHFELATPFEPRRLLSGPEADLVVLCDRALAQRCLREAPLQEALAKRLAPGACAWLEPAALPPGAREGGFALAGALRGRAFRVRPARGEVESAIPLGEPAPLGYFGRQGLEPASGGRGVAGLLAALLDAARPGRRFGVLVARAVAEPAERLPRYVRRLAESAGLDLSRARFGLSAPGRYRSRKIVFFLFEPGAGRPFAVVKVTREPALNQRLENEHRALVWLARRGCVKPGCVPAPLFLGHHAGRAVVGEGAVDGTPLRERIRGAPDLAPGVRVVDWLLELARASADRRSAAPVDAADALGCLLDRFVELYGPPREQRRFLYEQVSRLAEGAERFPLVFQHGDPGTWNLLWTREGELGVLDWEAAEVRGVPLWDLFYFLRSLAMSAPGQPRGGDWVARSAAPFLVDSPVHQLAVRATRRHRDALEIPSAWCEALFYTCWMHRALKEATRLRPGALEAGKYARLLERLIEARREPALRRLFA
jgi:hypothetical protein